MKLLLDMFAYPFIVRAFAVGILVSLCAALLGVPLVLKRYSMIGDGLSHVSFGALAVAVACGFAPLWFSIPIVVLAAFFLLRIAENHRVSADAAIAVLSASALAIGIIVSAVTLMIVITSIRKRYKFKESVSASVYTSKQKMHMREKTDDFIGRNVIKTKIQSSSGSHGGGRALPPWPAAGCRPGCRLHRHTSRCRSA